MERRTIDRSDAPRIRGVDAKHLTDLIRIGAETQLSPWSAESYLDEMKSPASIMLRLATADDDATIGFVVGRTVPSGTDEESWDAEIFNIAVDGGFQGQGNGQLLFDAFAGACRERNVSRIWLEVRESNRKAIAFYEKNGFERVQTRNHFYENPREHAILMKFDLKKVRA